MTVCCDVVAVINSKNIHTVDWNRGFESRIAHAYTLACSCTLFFSGGGGVRVGHFLIRVLQKV